MQPSGANTLVLPHSYHEERTAKTLLMGRLFSIIAMISVVGIAIQDIVLLRSGSFVGWGLAGLLPPALFLLFSVTLFRTRPALVIPFHVVSLLGVMIMACGYTYTTYLLAESRRLPGANAPLLLVTALFFLFAFASGARRYFAVAVLPPLSLLTIGLLIQGKVPAAALAHLSSGWILAAAGVAAGLAQDRLFQNEYAMRSLAATRKEELEREIERARALNDQLAREIEERKAIEAELERRAAIDELTDVYNRRAGMEILTRSLYLAQRNKHPLSVCFVDVDDLKMVNDNYGHSEGDRLLQYVITILKKHLRKSDYVSRIGGDEFIMVLPNCTRQSAEYIISRIAEELESEDSSELPYRVSISMGIADYEGDRKIDPDLLVKEADEEMYRTKQAKKREHQQQ